MIHSSNSNSPSTAATAALSRKQRVAARKVRDLEAAEQRLRQAEQWSHRRGDVQRAAAYNRQAEAAREERRQWLDILKPRPAITSHTSNAHPPTDSDTVHLLSILIVVASMCVNITVSVHKLPQSVFMTLALLVTLYIFTSTSTTAPSSQTESRIVPNDGKDVSRQATTPEPWSKVVARRELASKANAKSQVLLPMVSRAKLCHSMRTKL